MTDRMMLFALAALIALAGSLIIGFSIAAWRRLRRLQRQQLAMQQRLEEISAKLFALQKTQDKALELRQEAELEQLALLEALQSGQALHGTSHIEIAQLVVNRFDRLETTLLSMQAGSASASGQPGDAVSGVWQRLVQDVIDGKANALPQLQLSLRANANVQLIGVADLRKYQNNAHYAEFTVQSTGECLLIPLQDATAGRFIALPYPGDPEWFVRNHELMSRLFTFTGEWTNANKLAHIQQAAILKEKGENGVYELVQQGVLMF